MAFDYNLFFGNESPEVKAEQEANWQNYGTSKYYDYQPTPYSYSQLLDAYKTVANFPGGAAVATANLVYDEGVPSYAQDYKDIVQIANDIKSNPKEFVLKNSGSIFSILYSSNVDPTPFIQTAQNYGLNPQEQSQLKSASDAGLQYANWGNQQKQDFQNRRGNLFGSNSLVGTLAPIAAAVALPGVGEMLVPSLISAGIPAAVAPTVGAALASTAVQVAQGVPLETALNNAAISSVVQTGSTDVAKEIVKAGANPTFANAVTSVGGSVVSTAARGGTADDITRNAIGALVGSGVATASDGDKALANAAATLASGGTATQALTSYGAQIGREIGQEAAATPSASVTPSAQTTPAAESPLEPTAEVAPAPSVVETSPVVAETATQPSIPTDVFAQPDYSQYQSPTETPSLPPVEVTAQAPTDAQIIDLIQTADTNIAGPLPTAGPLPVTPPADVSPNLPQVDVVAQAEPEAVIADTIAPVTPAVAQTPAAPVTETPSQAVAETAPAPSLPEVTVTAEKEEPVIVDTTQPPPIDKPPTAPAPAEDTAVAEEEPLAEEKPTKPYKPELFIFGGVAPKSRAVSRALSAPLNGVYQSPLQQALTSFVPAGEITGDPTGKKRENVWNEASLRLKDALGL
jgi:hypothetical protein